ncbi:HNH endonuclease family protein [Kribbella sp. NPDC023972]|uniref:HNH endonuclease family protein n=1 Tax=Kribbella sp. NPDC023972 TaxID=3154795 RepID=UPI0033E6B6C0
MHLPLRIAALSFALLLAAGCTIPIANPATHPNTTPTALPTSTPRPSTSIPAPATPGRPTAEQIRAGAAELAALTTAVRGPRVKDPRDRFGSAWKDVDHTGCDQRNEALARALRDRVFRPGSTCVVQSGILDDPYSGQPISFQRGRSLVDIDHVVPLGHAIRVGAATWTQTQREQFAGDLTLELMPVSASLNRQKGDAPPDGWLPPNKDYRCTYALRWIAIKAHWHLTITATERTTLSRLVAGCRPTRATR